MDTINQFLNYIVQQYNKLVRGTPPQPIPPTPPAPPVKPDQPDQPVNPDQPVQPVKPDPPVQPVQPVKPIFTMTDVIYEISIKNDSGSDQNYCIFNDQPLINNVVREDIWMNVFQKKMIPDGGTGLFKITKKFGAVCGYADKTPNNNVSVSVGTPKAVSLGIADDSGNLKTKGTTFTVKIENGTPRFSKDPQTNGGLIGAFEIITGDIDYEMAQNKNWLIGLGGDTSGTGLDGPAATFVPQGHKSYQIQPVTKYWISTADYSEGSMIKVAAVADKSVLIDYSERTSWKATVKHSKLGALSLQV